jgi:hypothetical protein
MDTGFRADWVVEDKVIVEIKSVESLAPVHYKQLLTYLCLADKRLGLLINFNVPLIKNGITRVVNGLQEDDHASRKDAKTFQNPISLSLRFQGRSPWLFLVFEGILLVFLFGLVITNLRLSA